MAVRNIDKMYFNYGYGSGFCHQCPHFRKECWNKQSKRHIVGSLPDGKPQYEYESFLACGLIDKEWPNEDGQLPGQMEMQIVRRCDDGRAVYQAL